MIFKASLDKLAKGVTIAVTILFLILIIAPLFVIGKQGLYISVLEGVLFVLIYGISYGLRPTAYSLSQDCLSIHRPFSDVKLSRNSIEKITLLQNNDLKMSIRLFGSGGLFGYYGIFTNSKFGKMTWYATQRSNMLLIETKSNKKIVISPDDYQLFLKEITPLAV